MLNGENSNLSSIEQENSQIIGSLNPRNGGKRGKSKEECACLFTKNSIRPIEIQQKGYKDSHKKIDEDFKNYDEISQIKEIFAKKKIEITKYNNSLDDCV